MADRFGPRGAIAFPVPAQNASMQRECEATRPEGVSLQVHRFDVSRPWQWRRGGAVGRPVVSVNAAVMWAACRRLGIDPPLPGIGTLSDTPLSGDLP